MKFRKKIRVEQLILVDETNNTLEFIIWSQKAENFKCEKGEIIAVNSVKVSDFFNNKKNIFFNFFYRVYF